MVAVGSTNYEMESRAGPHSLYWAVKRYSRVLGQPVWIVFRYPHQRQDEFDFEKAKKNLGLSTRVRTRQHQIWPSAFKPVDGSPCFQADDLQIKR